MNFLPRIVDLELCLTGFARKTLSRLDEMLINDFVLGAVFQEKDKICRNMQQLTKDLQQKYNLDFGTACTIVVNAMSFAIPTYLIENVSDPKESIVAVQNILTKSIENLGQHNLEYMVPRGSA